MASIEDGVSTRKCEWRGKSEISSTWSGKRGVYCSFKCSAAGDYRMYSAIATIFTIMVSMVIILGMMMQIDISSNPSALLVLVVPQVGLVGLLLMFIYAAYIGRSMRRERNINL